MKCPQLLFVLSVVFLFSCSPKSSLTNAPPANASPTPVSNSSTPNAGNIDQVQFDRLFVGSIDNKYEIRMNLRRNGRELAGSYSYKKVGTSIDLKGTLDEQQSFIINEFDSHGNSTGVFKGSFVSDNRLEGTWSKPNDQNKMPFSLEADEGGSSSTSGDADILAQEGVYEGLDAEAYSEAKKYWAMRISKCGDSFYAKDNIFVHEFKEFEFNIEPSSISRADSLNGMEWSGRTKGSVALTRTYSPKPTLHYNPGWSKWSNGLYEGGTGLWASIVKENRHWTVTPGFAAGGGLVALRCSEIPR